MSIEKVRVSVVKYLNSAPFYYGLENFKGDLPLELHYDTPADCAAKLMTGIVDAGLVPVAVIPLLPESYIIGEYCIGADGPVMSVRLVGDNPVECLKRIYLDPHSRTSVKLIKILASELWKRDYTWLDTGDGFEKHLISGSDGGVVIGDKVFGILDRYEYQYDMAESWIELTGLPFVFAVWVANRRLDPLWIDNFNRALELGLGSIPEFLKTSDLNSRYPGIDLHSYLTKNVSYPLDKQKRAGMALFLEKIKSIQ